MYITVRKATSLYITTMSFFRLPQIGFRHPEILKTTEIKLVIFSSDVKLNKTGESKETHCTTIVRITNSQKTDIQTANRMRIKRHTYNK